MAESLKWVLELKDALSAPAQAAAGSLVQLQIELKQTERQLTSLEKAAHGITVGKGIVGALSGGLSLVADMAGGVLEVVEGAVTGFAKLALSGYSFREDTLVAFQQLLGSGEKADELFENALRVAKLTKFETRDVVNLYTDLLGAQFKQGDLNTLVAGLSDVGTARGPEKMQQLEHALMKVQSQGKLTADALGEITLAGVSRVKINEQLAKALHIKETDAKKLGDKVAAALKKGTVDSGMGIGAVLDAIHEMFDKGGQLGDFAKAQSETLSGVYSNFKEAFSNLFMSKETQNLQGFKTLKDTMKMLSGFMDTSTANGQRLLGVVNNLVSDMLKLIDLDPAHADQAFKRVLGWVESIESGVKRVTTWISEDLLPTMGDAFGKGGLGEMLSATLQEVMRVAGGHFMAGIFEAAGMQERAEKARANIHWNAREITKTGAAGAAAGAVGGLDNPIVMGPAVARAPGAPAAAPVSSNANTTNIHPGAIVVNVQGGQDAAKEVEGHLTRMVGRLNRAPSKAER